MAQIVKLKRTSVQGKVPTISNVELGELAMNTYDGRIFFEKSSSNESIQEILTTNTGRPITGSINLNGSITASYFKGDGSALTNVNANISEQATVTSSFDNSSTIDVAHNFSSKNVIVSVYDNNDNQIIPQTVSLTSTDNVRVVLSSAQSGFVVVAKGGHVLSGSADNSNQLNGQLASYYLNYNNFTNVPSGLVSGSSQITLSSTTGYNANEHFTQANITTVGTVTSGNVNAILPSGTVSGSDQVASTFAQTILDDTSAGAVRTTIGVDAAGTDNSTDVTLTGTPNYITISGQVITRNTIDIGDDTNLTAGTGITLTGDTLSTTDSEIVHDNLSGFVANEHIDHSTITVGSGKGLSGGGTINVSRSLTLATGSSHFLDGVKQKLDTDNVLSGSLVVQLPSGVISGSSQVVLNDADKTGFDTDDVTEGSNLYYTDARVKTKLDAEAVLSGSSHSGDQTFDDNVIITGNLTVSGTTTSVNSNTVNIGDNIIVLNSDESGTPSQDGGIEIERGTSTNVRFQFKESTDRWQFTNDGSTYFNLPTSTADVAEYSNLYYTDARVKTKLNTDGVISGSEQVTNIGNSQLSNSSITINGVAISLGGSVSTPNDNTQLSTEEVQDIVGGMLGGTETGITVTYQDGTGDIDFVVASQTDNNFTNTLKSKLDGIESSADVTDSGNVVPILNSNTVISGSSQVSIGSTTGTLAVNKGGTGATTAAGARTNLGVDAAGTDNSTDVTLAGSYDYITISGQTITRNQVDASTDISNLTTSNVSEGTNQYYTDARVLNYINDRGVVSGSAQVVSSLVNQDIDLGTGDITATTGSFDVIDLDRLSLTSTQTTVPPLQLTANSLQDGVGALRIDGSQADIFLNPSTATHTTVTFAVNNDQRLAFGMDNNSDFYITRRTGGTWYDDTFVLDRDTGKVTLGYDLTVNGNINATNGIVSGSSQITDLTTHKETVSGASSYAVDHNLSEQYPIVQAWNTATSQQEIPISITTNSVNRVTVVFSTTFAGVIIVKK